MISCPLPLPANPEETEQGGGIYEEEGIYEEGGKGEGGRGREGRPPPSQK